MAIDFTLQKQWIEHGNGIGRHAVDLLEYKQAVFREKPFVYRIAGWQKLRRKVARDAFFPVFVR
ncbi:hypothetical protein SDC9_89762 [bioreactor metagenome]|uniref:Uncharacterized protein n=1 Tax=bioreactor metagenome TaxID=1076179 RepID=A0A644ZQ32_9ZZZZ